MTTNLPQLRWPTELPEDRYAWRRYDHLGELVAEADREPPWRVVPIAADGHVALLSAAGGEGKTWASLAFPGAAAHRAPVASVRRLHRVVIFDAQNGHYALGSRAGALEPGRWSLSGKRKTAMQVATYDVSQVQDRLLIERDICVYENRQGLIPAGTVWSVREHVERDWRRRVMGSSS